MLTLAHQEARAAACAGGAVLLDTQLDVGHSVWRLVADPRVQVFVCGHCGFAALDEDVSSRCGCTFTREPLAGGPLTRRPKVPTCGVCDVVTYHIRCEQCQEPACPAHAQTVRVVESDELRWLDVQCAREQIAAGLVEAYPAPTPVLAALHEWETRTGGGVLA